MPQAFGNGLIKKISASGEGLIKKIYACYTPGEVALVYSASTQITYKVDTGTAYIEEIEYGSSALAPKTFTPTKSGYTFVGWRTDTAASSSVLTEKDVDTEEFTLYAVFKKTVTLSYNGNGSTDGSTPAQSGIKYYNNGNVLGATITLPDNGFVRTNYTFSRWSMGSISGTKYNAGSNVTITENTTMYALWKAETFTTSMFTIHGYGNASWPNAVKEESTPVVLIPSIDLTGFSSIKLDIYVFHSSESIEYNNNHGARARIKMDNTVIIDLSTHVVDDHQSSVADTATYDCSAISGAHAIKHCYYNMDGACEASKCYLTFISSSEEV